jgi:hypothetical protein
MTMKKLVLTTAVLLASTALAAAQGTSAQGSMNDKAKAEHAAPAAGAHKNGASGKMAPQAQYKARETTGQAPKAENDSKAGAQLTSEPPKAKADTKADTKAGANGKAGADTKMNAQKDEKAGNKSAAENKANDKTKAAQTKDNEKNGKASAQNERNGKNSTTGQGAAGARAANLTTEQKTKIRTVIKEKVKAKPVEHVNFSVSVGTVVPRTIHYYPLPAEVVTIYPAWRGYYFVLVGSQIVVIQPSSFEIVAVLA